MPRGARIGTCSLRRGLQLRNRMPDLEIVSLRGNLDTRIRKIETEGLDGVIVAAAGIRRMGWVAKVSQFIPVELMLPAVGQGVLGIETRRDDARVRGAVAFLNDPVTGCEVGAERAFLKRLGGGCQLPIAGYAKKTGGTPRSGGAGGERRRAGDDPGTVDGRRRRLYDGRWARELAGAVSWRGADGPSSTRSMSRAVEEGDRVAWRKREGSASSARGRAIRG